MSVLSYSQSASTSIPPSHESRPSSMSMVDSVASSSSISQVLIRLSGPIRETLEITPYTPPDGSNIFIKSNLLSLLPPNPRESIRVEIRDFCLCCAALASASSVDSGPISWIPRPLSAAANSAVAELSEAVYSGSDGDGLIGAGDCGAHFSLAPKESRLVGELMPDVLPLLTGVIKESSIGSEDVDEIAAASARAPVAEAIIAAHQFRWFVTQVNYPYLGKVCNLVLPCALTALDHWSPEVKGQGMVSLIHLAKNVNAAELGWYEDVVLDACCRNIASSDELWHHVVEMSVLLVTCIQRRNPRSPWFERMLSEMLGHLERQPKNKQRRMSWLQLIEPLFNAMGLVLLAHFRRIFPLFFKWMHVDDDETVLLVLDLVHTIVKLTWIRNTPYIDRLVDELILVYKESAMRKGREAIRSRVLQILLSLQQCKGPRFTAAWDKHKDDPNLTSLALTFGKINTISVVQ